LLILIGFKQFIQNITTKRKPRFWSRRRWSNVGSFMATFAIGLWVNIEISWITWFPASNWQESDRPEICFTSKFNW